jgi:Outer membrane protein beta-barrel domain
MQNIENDMDELFRRAVDQAPLLPTASRWDEIAGKLSGHSAHSVTREKTNHLKKISGAFGYLFSGAIILTILTTFIKHQEIKMQYNSSVGIANSAIEKVANSKDQGRKYSPAPKKENNTYFSPLPYPVIHGKQSENLSMGTDNEDYKYSTMVSSEKRIENIQIVNVYPPISFVSSLHPLALDNLLQSHKPLAPAENPDNSHSLTLVNLNSLDNSRFYLSLTGGPLISQIKSQELKKTGFDMGLLVGYRISKKLSVETGLLYSKQYYFSGGKYYNAATGGNTVNSMQGGRTAFEIPFKLNYYLLRNKSGGLYISGGLSSYVGVNDKIVINVGENPLHPPQKLDYGLANYLPSYLDFALGYDYKSGKSTHFKIEPYLQIPLSSTAGNTININAGGGLQVYNAGLHLIITEFIH